MIAEGTAQNVRGFNNKILKTSGAVSDAKMHTEQVKGKQVKFLHDLVTVNRERSHLATGRPGRRLTRGSVSQETCLLLVRGQKSRITSS